MLDAGAQRFLGRLLADFGPRVAELLAARERRRQRVAAGEFPEFDRSSRPAIAPGWHGREPLPDRRVTIHAAPQAGPLGAALASEADAVLVSLEDALSSPAGALAGLLAVREALATGATGEQPPLVLEPRALDRLEPGLAVGGHPVPAALVDAGLYLYHHPAGTAYLRLSRLESVDEALWWRDVLRHAAEHGAASAVDVTLGIDSVPGVFAAEDMLHALRDHVSAFAAGRPAYLRSVISTFRRYPQFILPDRAELTMARHFLRSWGLMQVRTAHRRNVSALAPVSLRITDGDTDADGRRLARFRHAATRAVRDGFDGIGVHDPALVPVAREVFDRALPHGHQRHRAREDIHIEGADLTQITTGKITEHGLRQNLRIALAGLAYSAAGEPAFTLAGHAEHGASVELAAAQLWQWVHLPTGILAEGRIIDADLFDAWLAEEAAHFKDTHHYRDARDGRGDSGDTHNYGDDCEDIHNARGGPGPAARLRDFVLADDLGNRLL
ncbi:MAG: hypothetical protein U5K76_04435 [Woeseiaceae bacterium]|nr:hypothetical protein [Woeseiaceae bacterium]